MQKTITIIILSIAFVVSLFLNVRGDFVPLPPPPEKTAEMYNNLGDFYIDMAIEHYKKAAELEVPNDKDKAVEYYKKAIELKPDYADALSDEKLFIFSKNKDFLEVKIKAIAEKITEPKTADDFFIIVTATIRDPKYLDSLDAVKKYFNRVIELEPNYSEAYSFIGWINYIGASDLTGVEKAIEYLEKAIEVNPKNTNSYAWIGWLYYNFEVYDKAKEYFGKIIELNPNLAYPYYLMGRIYYEQKNYDDAIKHYDKAIEYFNKSLKLDSNGTTNATTYHFIGVAYLGKKDYDMALEYLNKTPELDSYSSWTYFNIGMSYVGKKDYSKAIEYYKKSYELDTAWIRLKIAIEYFEKNNRLDPYLDPAYDNDYDREIEYLKKALELDFNNAEIYRYIGLAYKDKKDYDKAIECFNKALELGYDKAAAYTNIGDAYYEKRNFDKAIKNLEKAIELNPDLEQAYYNMGKVYGSKGDKTKELYYKNNAIATRNKQTKELNSIWRMK